MSDSNVPKIRGFAIAVHEEMASTATTEDGVIKWQGSVAQIFRQLGISQGYHTPIMRMLEKTGCLQQMQKGTRGINSIYVLTRSPAMLTEAEWPSVNSIVKSSRQGLTTERGGYKLLEQEIKNVAGRVGELNIPTALMELQNQINGLTEKITEIERLLNAK